MVLRPDRRRERARPVINEGDIHIAMGTIFVAYGGGEHRNRVLETAVEQASSDDHDVLVYHVMTEQTPAERRVRDEIRSVVQQQVSYVAYDIEIDGGAVDGTGTDVSKETKLVEAIDRPDQAFEYVVMGDVNRGPVEQFTHSSMTRAVLNEATCPVMLVPF